MFQLQALHPLAHGTKKKEEHGHPWLFVSVMAAITFSHCQGISHVCVPSMKSGIAYGPGNLSKMCRCILAAERQECPADYQQCASWTLIEVAANLSSVETITIPDTSRKYARIVAYERTSGSKTTPGQALLNPPRNPKAASLAVQEVYAHLSKTQPGTQLARQKLAKTWV